MAISNLNADEIINISSTYGSWFKLEKEEIDQIKLILIEKGYQKFYIFHYIAKVKNFLILSKNLKFTIKVPMERERLFLEELNKACFIKIRKREKEEGVLYNNEIYATIDVYY